MNDAAGDVGHLVFVETRQTNGVQVVDEGSADLGLAKVQPVGADANHFDISRAFVHHSAADPRGVQAECGGSVPRSRRQRSTPQYATESATGGRGCPALQRLSTGPVAEVHLDASAVSGMSGAGWHGLPMGANTPRGFLDIWGICAEGRC